MVRWSAWSGSLIILIERVINLALSPILSRPSGLHVSTVNLRHLMRYSVYRLLSLRTCSPAAQTSNPVDKRIENYRRFLACTSFVVFHPQCSRTARSSLLCSSLSLLISREAAPSCVTAGREWEEVSSRENTCDGEGALSSREHLFLRGSTRALEPCRSRVSSPRSKRHVPIQRAQLGLGHL